MRPRERVSYPNMIPRNIVLRSLGLLLQGDVLIPPPECRLEQITNLTLFTDSYEELPSQFFFPSLRTLTLDGLDEMRAPLLTPFLIQHQLTLKHIHISSSFTYGIDILTSLLRTHPTSPVSSFPKTMQAVLGCRTALDRCFPNSPPSD